MITLGTLVISVCDGCVGIITWCDDPNKAFLPKDRVYKVAWADGNIHLHCNDEFEVLA